MTKHPDKATGKSSHVERRERGPPLRCQPGADQYPSGGTRRGDRVFTQRGRQDERAAAIMGLSRPAAVRSPGRAPISPATARRTGRGSASPLFLKGGTSSRGSRWRESTHCLRGPASVGASHPRQGLRALPVLGEMLGGAAGISAASSSACIARALIEAQVLLLDEPTEGIQPSIIKDPIRDRDAAGSGGDGDRPGGAVFRFAHALADQMVVMDRGAVV